jgi:NADH-quinone oxidoreductase subunit G
MPRPIVKEVTFSIDGLEVTAPEGVMLVDGAKYGDVEIPVFCYEPKLGQPVGACRMCLVEIEGIPKLQTACSTPVRDGMVVHTQTQRVHEAQRAVVEFLLINHPLDCPVCDKGGECPLQDVTYGWGPGTSRFIEPKRHFKKPLELSPLIAIDRERCILCYRCVRYSQEISEDDQLILLERGANSFVGTFDGHPYVAPFSGNIIELCPVGALTSRAYRFRARPWDVEGAGTVCAGCASQCNVELTVRDERVMRVLARDHEGVDDGWLCDKGRFSYQAAHVDERITEPMVREGAELLPASWDKALAAAASALEKAGDRAAALANGTSTNEEAFLLQGLIRDHLGSSHLSSRIYGEQPLDVQRALADPKLQATVPDLEFAHTVLLIDCDPIDEAPVWDLRIRKGIRRRGVKLVVASARPTALDASAAATLRFAPGAGEAFLVALDAALSGDEGNLGGAASAAGTSGPAIRAFVEALRAAGEEIVIVYGERALRGQAGRALLNLAARLDLGGIAGAGLLELPATPNGRGVREAGFAPGHGPGYATPGSDPAHPSRSGLDAAGMAEGLASGELHTVWLHHADPLRTHPDRRLWDRALHTAQTVIAVDSVITDSIREHADVVFPAEAYPEKEGTLVHPDGRVQRLRPAIARARRDPAVPGSGVRPLWQVISEISKALGHDPGINLTGAQASQKLFAAVPFFEGLTLDEIGGRGVRWPERHDFVSPAWEPVRLEIPAGAPPAHEGALRLGTWRPLWANKDVDVSPILHFARARQTAELSPVDAEALGIREGDRVEVRQNGSRVRAGVKLRSAIPPGTVFLAEATKEDPANVLTEPLVTIERVGATKEPV